MVDPANVEKYQRTFAELHNINTDKLRHPIQFYMEPEDHEHLDSWRNIGVFTVGDFLFWCMYYGATHNPPRPVTRASVNAILARIKET